MANPDRDTAYTTDRTDRTVYTRETSSTGWFVGIIVALALLAIGYLVFSANTGPTTSTTVNTTPGVTDTAPATDTTTTPMAPATEAPPATETAPAETAPATEAPATEPAAPATEPAPAAGG